MGLFQGFKDTFRLVKELQTIEKKAREAEERWRNTTAREAAALSDEALWDCITSRLDDSDLNSPGVRRTLYAVYLFDLEVQNGGLCQYFDNCPECASALEEALTALAAEPYLALLHDALAEQKIDLAQFGTTGSAQLLHCGQQCEEHCPFAAFDSAYEDLCSEAPLEALCVSYARAHLQELF